MTRETTPPKEKRPFDKAMADTVRRHLAETFDRGLADWAEGKSATGYLANPTFPVAVVFVVHPHAHAIANALVAGASMLMGSGPDGDGHSSITAIQKEEDKPKGPSVN